MMVYRQGGKRVLDLLLAGIALLCLVPLMTVIAIVLWVVQGQPIVFAQKRVGMSFNPFVLYKFRSMKQASSSDEARFRLGDKDHQTAIGKILRITKLDELPQLWNVIKGDMSLVGPRPEVPEWVEFDSDDWQRALSVRPGLTDFASLTFFDEEKQLQTATDPIVYYRDSILPRKLQLAQHYVREVSLAVDVMILGRTLKQLVRL
jgi:lipopolysaccharide/colanic/teichoic acid biosynthesis glycosyltransferase